MVVYVHCRPALVAPWGGEIAGLDVFEIIAGPVPMERYVSKRAKASGSICLVPLKLPPSSRQAVDEEEDHDDDHHELEHALAGMTGSAGRGGTLTMMDKRGVLSWWVLTGSNSAKGSKGERSSTTASGSSGSDGGEKDWVLVEKEWCHHDLGSRATSQPAATAALVAADGASSSSCGYWRGGRRVGGRHLLIVVERPSAARFVRRGLLMIKATDMHSGEALCFEGEVECPDVEFPISEQGGSSSSAFQLALLLSRLRVRLTAATPIATEGGRRASAAPPVASLVLRALGSAEGTLDGTGADARRGSSFATTDTGGRSGCERCVWCEQGGRAVYFHVGAAAQSYDGSAGTHEGEWTQLSVPIPLDLWRQQLRQARMSHQLVRCPAEIVARFGGGTGGGMRQRAEFALMNARGELSIWSYVDDQWSLVPAPWIVQGTGLGTKLGSWTGGRLVSGMGLDEGGEDGTAVEATSAHVRIKISRPGSLSSSVRSLRLNSGGTHKTHNTHSYPFLKLEATDLHTGEAINCSACHTVHSHIPFSALSFPLLMSHNAKAKEALETDVLDRLRVVLVPRGEQGDKSAGKSRMRLVLVRSFGSVDSWAAAHSTGDSSRQIDKQLAATIGAATSAHPPTPPEDEEAVPIVVIAGKGGALEGGAGGVHDLSYLSRKREPKAMGGTRQGRSGWYRYGNTSLVAQFVITPGTGDNEGGNNDSGGREWIVITPPMEQAAWRRDFPGDTARYQSWFDLCQMAERVLNQTEAAASTRSSSSSSQKDAPLSSAEAKLAREEEALGLWAQALDKMVDPQRASDDTHLTYATDDSHGFGYGIDVGSLQGQGNTNHQTSDGEGRLAGGVFDDGFDDVSTRAKAQLAVVRGNTHTNMGAVCIAVGRLGEALSHLRRAADTYRLAIPPSWVGHAAQHKHQQCVGKGQRRKGRPSGGYRHQHVDEQHDGDPYGCGAAYSRTMDLLASVHVQVAEDKMAEEDEITENTNKAKGGSSAAAAAAVAAAAVNATVIRGGAAMREALACQQRAVERAEAEISWIVRGIEAVEAEEERRRQRAEEEEEDGESEEEDEQLTNGELGGSVVDSNSGSHRRLMHHLHRLGELCAQQGQHAVADLYVGHALTRAREAGDAGAEALFAVCLADTAFSSAEMQGAKMLTSRTANILAAREEAEVAKLLKQEPPEPLLEGDPFDHVPIAAFEGSAELYDDACVVLQSLPEPSQQPWEHGRCVRRVGTCLVRVGRWDDALQYFEEGLHLARKHSDLLGEAECLETIGDVLTDNGQYEEALRFLREAALKRFQQQGQTEDAGSRHGHDTTKEMASLRTKIERMAKRAAKAHAQAEVDAMERAAAAP
jgi:tetratricopeptide (TPR) repeat protein